MWHVEITVSVKKGLYTDKMERRHNDRLVQPCQLTLLPESQISVTQTASEWKNSRWPLGPSSAAEDD